MPRRSNSGKTGAMTDVSSPPNPAPEPPNVDPDLLDDLVDAVDERDTRWLARTLQRMHPADAADLLEALPFDTFSEAVELLGGELPSDILIELRDRLVKVREIEDMSLDMLGTDAGDVEVTR